jgi:hypothetical protein
MSSLTAQAYQPTAEDEAFFAEVRGFILVNRKRFRAVGKQLDAEYSNDALIRREACEKLAKHRRAIISPGSSTPMEGLTRAWHRQHGRELYRNLIPKQRDDGGLKHPSDEQQHRHCSPGRYADGRRKPMSAFDRFWQTVTDIAEVIDRPGNERDSIHHLRQLPAKRAKEKAERVLLLTWLITDPDASEVGSRDPITEFQAWPWGYPDRDAMVPDDLMLDPMVLLDRQPEGERRYALRLAVFEEHPQWIEWARWAWTLQPVSALTGEHAVMLHVLMAANRAMGQEEIAASIVGTAGVAISRKTIGELLNDLRALGYTERPHGERGGDAITSRGRAVGEKTLPLITR